MLWSSWPPGVFSSSGNRCRCVWKGKWYRRRRDVSHEKTSHSQAQHSQLNTNLPSPLKHWLRSSLETRKITASKGKIIEALTLSSSKLLMWKHCAAVSAKFVSTFLTLFSIKISSGLVLLGPELLLTLSFLWYRALACTHSPVRAREGEDELREDFSSNIFPTQEFNFTFF